MAPFLLPGDCLLASTGPPVRIRSNQPACSCPPGQSAPGSSSPTYQFGGLCTSLKHFLPTCPLPPFQIPPWVIPPPKALNKNPSPPPPLTTAPIFKFPKTHSPMPKQQPPLTPLTTAPLEASPAEAVPRNESSCLRCRANTWANSDATHTVYGDLGAGGEGAGRDEFGEAVAQRVGCKPMNSFTIRLSKINGYALYQTNI